VLAGAAPAVISDLAVADDLAAGRLAEVRTPELDLGRSLRVVWVGTANPPAGPARDLVAHIFSRTTSSGRVAAPRRAPSPEC
jgi:DNA-binding transcriptional LysR family regulator